MPARRGKKLGWLTGSSPGSARVWKPSARCCPASSSTSIIDADKIGYAEYYEQALARLRPGGLILLDNMLQGGNVVGDLADDEDVAAIRSLNEVIAADPRVEVVLIPIGDGVSSVQKLGEQP